MIRVPSGAVILDAAEVDYVARALQHLAQLMAERRDAGGNPTPSQPNAKLSALTAKLRRAVDLAGPLAVSDPAAEQDQQSEAPVKAPDVRATQQDSVNANPHDIGTGDAARRLGITPNAVRDAVRRGRLPATRTGTRWRFDAAAVDAYADDRAPQRR